MQLQILELYEKHYQEPELSCALAVREVLFELSEDFSDGIKYGMPFILYKGKNFAYFWRDKKTRAPYIGFTKGKHLEHPALKEEGRNTIKVLHFDPEEDLPLEAIIEVTEMQRKLFVQ